MLSVKEPIIVPARGCKYIAGDPRQSGWSYCGEKLVGSDSSWCAEHHALVYGRPPAKPKAVAEPANNAKTLSTPKKAPETNSPAAPKASRSLEDPMLMG